MILNHFFWRRYVDDIFFIAKEADLNDTTRISNDIDNPIKVNIEIKNIAKLPFLDILIDGQTTDNSQFIATTVYKKPISTGQYNNFNSVCPFCRKIAVLKTLAFRVIRYLSYNNDFDNEKNISRFG